MAPVPGDSPKTPVWHVDAARGPSTPSLDHLFGNGEQRGRNAESERCGRLAVDRQLEFGRLLDREITRLLAFEDAIDTRRRLPVRLRRVDAVGYQASGHAAGCGWKSSITRSRQL